jgi:poly-gamma-glutamate capsule biosynthesis protein CapA/YwtB (metallophosphatase superfamily)
MQRFRLNGTTPKETEWLRALLTRESRGLRFEITSDGLIKGSR